MTAPKNILVLSVSAGAGHMRAAQALCDAAQDMPGLQLEHADVMAWSQGWFRTIYSKAYIQLVERAPLSWTWLYQHSDKAEQGSWAARLRRLLQQWGLARMQAELAQRTPDAIVCTHFLPAEWLAQRIARGLPTPPVWVLVTDFDVHGMWVQPHMQGYCVGSSEVAARLQARGIPAGRIHVTGIAVAPAFLQPPPRAQAAAELDMDAAKTTVLLMAGGAGVGAMDALLAQVAALPRNIQIIALAGRNAALQARLQAIAAQHPQRIRVLGFTTTIERVMAATDVAVTKPGGLTVSECLVAGLPMVLIAPIPGQEERNADMLLENGCALKAVDAAALAYKLLALIDAPEKRAHMRTQQALVAKPHAARAVLQCVQQGLPRGTAAPR